MVAIMFVTASLPVFAALLGLVAGTCYKQDGLPFNKIRPDDGDWIPCDPSSSIASCCSSKDYCLGNGLCLDAGANNFFSIQGCTDSTWPSPCLTTNECVDSMRDGYTFIWPCRQDTNSTFFYCCGETADCCGNTTTLIKVTGVTEINKPTLYTTVGAVSTTTVTVTALSTSPVGQVSPTPQPCSTDSTRNMAIGVGVGVGAGLLLIAALVFFGCQLRKSRKEPDQPLPPNTVTDIDKSPISMSMTPQQQAFQQDVPQYPHQQYQPPQPQPMHSGYQPEPQTAAPGYPHARPVPVTHHVLELGGGGQGW